MAQSFGDLFFAPIQPFVWNPTACFMMASGFGVLLLLSFGQEQMPGRPWVWGFLVPVAAWVAFGWYEGEMRRQGMNIRIDLLFLTPLLYLVTVIGIGLWIGTWMRGLRGR